VSAEIAEPPVAGATVIAAETIEAFRTKVAKRRASKKDLFSIKRLLTIKNP
jgi:hypothetical protein